MLTYKIMAYIFFPVLQFMGQDLLSFNELVSLQGFSQGRFDSTVKNIGFDLVHIKHNDNWKSDRYVYSLSKLNDDSLTRIERVIDSVHFGENDRLQLIVTLDFVMYNKEYYNNLLAECKKSGYILFGTNNYNREYPNMTTHEYRKGANVAKFSIGKLEGSSTDFFIVSVSSSPK